MSYASTVQLCDLPCRHIDILPNTICWMTGTLESNFAGWKPRTERLNNLAFSHFPSKFVGMATHAHFLWSIYIKSLVWYCMVGGLIFGESSMAEHPNPALVKNCQHGGNIRHYCLRCRWKTKDTFNTHDFKSERWPEILKYGSLAVQARIFCFQAIVIRNPVIFFFIFFINLYLTSFNFYVW